MNYPESVTLEYLDAKEIINKKLARLTTWQALIVLLYLHGVSLAEFADICTEAGEPISRQGVQYQFKQGCKTMGVYWSGR